MKWSLDRWNPLLLAGSVVALWTFLTTTEAVEPIILPPPWSVILALVDLFGDEAFVASLLRTLLRVGVALGLATVMGIPFGLILGSHSGIHRLLAPFVHGLRSVPATALFPLFLIVIGVGEVSVIALAAYPSLLAIAVSSATGAMLANSRRLQQVQALGLNRWEILSEYLFFEALPHIFDGLRIAASYALVLVVAVEMFIGAGDRGLGRAIFDYQSTYRVPETYAAILVTAFVGIALNRSLSAVESRVLRWLPNTRTREAQ